jgi:hypothetical protein
MGWFTRDEVPVYEFESVISDDGTIWPAFTDDNGVLWIDVDYEVEITVDRVIIQGVIYPAWVDDNGCLRVEVD